MLLARHRSLIAGALAAVAVLAGLSALAPGPGATVPVVTAARDLRWGAALTSGDLAVSRVPTGSAPDGALGDPAAARGRLLASPVRRGEPITDVRLVGPALLASAPAGMSDAAADGLVAVGVRIADAGMAALLRPGAVVDVLSAAVDDWSDGAFGSGPSAWAEVVASAVRVLAVPGGRQATVGGNLDGALVLVAVSEAQAARLAEAQANRRLSMVLRPDNVVAP
jgi:Flp pilus assembly protein CpaB